MIVNKQLVRAGLLALITALSVSAFVPAAPQNGAPPGTSQQEVTNLYNRAKPAYGKGDWAAAETAFQAALQKAMELHDPRVGAFETDLVTISNGLKNYDQALKYAGDALAALQQIEQTDGTKSLIALTYFYRGNTYNAIGKFDLAMRDAQTSLALYEPLHNAIFILGNLNNIDSLFPQVTTYEAMTDYLNHALALRIQYGKPLDVALSHRTLALGCIGLGQYDNALDHYMQAIPVLEQATDSDDLMFAATSESDTADIYLLQGMYDRALLHYNEAVRIGEQVKDNPQFTDDIRSQIYDNRGCAKLALGLALDADDDFTMAKNLMTRALTAAGKGASLTLKLVQAQTEINHNMIAFSLGPNSYVGAVRALTAVVRRPELQKAPDLAGQAYYALGYFALLQHNNAMACQYLEKAIGKLSGLPDKLALGQAQAALGVADLRLQRATEAQEQFFASIGNLEAFSAQIGDCASAAAFRTSRFDPYSALAASLHRNEHDLEALAVVERGRAVGLARQAALNEVAYENLLSPADSVEYRQLTQALGVADRHLATVQGYGDNRPVARGLAAPMALHMAEKLDPEVLRQYEAAAAALEAFRTKLRTRNANYANFSGLGSHNNTRDAEIAAHLTKLAADNPDTLYLEWATLDDRTTLLFALTSKGVRCLELPVDAAMLTTQRAHWINGLTAEAQKADASNQKRKVVWRGVQQDEDAEPQYARALYNLVLARLERERLLPDDSAHGAVKRIVWTPDSTLQEIPLAALLDGKGRRLIQRFPLSVSFSLDALTWPLKPRAARGTLFYAADPELPQQEVMNGASHTYRDALMSDRQPLTLVRKSALHIAALFLGAQGVVGAEATEAAVKRRMQDYSILLFATHGGLQPNGLRSWLMFRQDHGEDGPLEAREVANMSLAARLAVLCACESGRSGQSGGEALLGMAWAFRAAGCPSIVGSLWKVKQEPTAALMEALFHGLQAARKDEALQSAMKAAIRGSNKPYEWAAFQIVGDTRRLP